MADPSFCAPTHESLVADLVVVRERGLLQLRRLDTPALRSAASYVAGGTEPHHVESLLRRALTGLGPGEFGDAAALLLGLEPGYRGRLPAALRTAAAKVFEMSSDTFRKTRERPVIEQLAEMILAVIDEGKMRDAREAMVRRHPAESRLAVQWVERFEAYYRIWTPVYALGADLTAYRATLLEADRPWDKHEEPGRVIDPMTLETEPYTQEYQAEGYVRFAIFRFASFLWKMHEFKMRHGGFWLLSSSAVETEVSNAVYRIGWHSPNNERDDSWMRVSMKEAGQELHLFQHLLTTTTVGTTTHDEWQQWAAACTCTWNVDAEQDSPRFFPDASTHKGISDQCQVHSMIAACNDYCLLIDKDWMAIADWYQLDEDLRKRASPDSLYQAYMSGPEGP